jgi:hypothetical protein
MGSNLRAVHTVGINLRHWERFASRQPGYVHRFGFHEAEFTIALAHDRPLPRAEPVLDYWLSSRAQADSNSATLVFNTVLKAFSKL